MMTLKRQKLQYNERSWAIDLISAINKNVSSSSSIQRAGGEFSLGGSGQTIFPDVILFGSSSNGSILQGWELKMPDTAIDDPELLKNAEEKARRLGLNSFLVWNAVDADLYIQNKYGAFTFSERLHENKGISSRSDVENRRDLWDEALHIILGKLNNFFAGGIISGVSAERLFGDNNFIENILQCQAKVKQYIENAAQKDNRLKAKIETWWRYVKESYPDERPYSPLAYSILLRWINRFVFANILKVYNQKDVPSTLKHGISVKECINLFTQFSKSKNVCNFFQSTEFDELIPSEEWEILLSFNEFLNSIEFSRISPAILTNILHATTLSSIKNAAGLFVTPEALAFLLVYLALKDKTENSIDPFCGTGTILNAMLAVKTDDNIPGTAVLETTWGSDKFAFPIQIAAMAVFSPKNVGRLMRIFTFDALNLAPGEKIRFIDPATGQETLIELPLFASIISNLPFINFEQIEELNKLVWDRITDFYKKYGIKKTFQLSRRSDFYSYIPFILYDLLMPNGTLGIITSNAWLASDWGVGFRKLLRSFYNINYVVTSAKGRWFSSADVVTTILVCSKKSPNKGCLNNKTVFVSTNQSIYDDNFSPDEIATSILAEDANDQNVSLRAWNYSQIEMVENLGLGWTSLFADLSWLFENQDKFVPLNKICNITRGERRGWDPMFILPQEDDKNIDRRFLIPYLKNINGYYNLTIDTADSWAFVCNVTPAELELENNISGKKWIDSFKVKSNKKGKPLTESLKISNGEWYQFKVKAYADFVLPLNPDTRIYAVRALQKMVLNQRLVCVTLKEKYGASDITFFHALLNSTLSMLMIELLGFGRGLGVLDITPTKIQTGFLWSSPDLFDQHSREIVVQAFAPLLARQAMAVPDELRQLDRQELDKAILNAMRIDYKKYRPIIYKALTTLYDIRKSVIKEK